MWVTVPGDEWVSVEYAYQPEMIAADGCHLRRTERSNTEAGTRRTAGHGRRERRGVAVFRPRFPNGKYVLPYAVPASLSSVCWETPSAFTPRGHGPADAGSWEPHSAACTSQRPLRLMDRQPSAATKQPIPGTARPSGDVDETPPSSCSGFTWFSRCLGSRSSYGLLPDHHRVPWRGWCVNSSPRTVGQRRIAGR